MMFLAQNDGLQKAGVEFADIFYMKTIILGIFLKELKPFIGIFNKFITIFYLFIDYRLSFIVKFTLKYAQPSFRTILNVE